MTRDLDHLHAEIARAVRADLARPGPGFEHRLLEALHAPPLSRQRRGRRLMAVVSVGLSVLVVAALLWTSPGFRARLRAGPRPGSAPAAQPAPTVRAETAGTAFFYQSVRPPLVAFGSVRAADWSGAALPALQPATGTLGIEASPDGRYLKGGVEPASTVVIDRSGAVVSTVNQNFDLWADDSRHLCSLDLSTDGGFPLAIRTGTLVPGGAVTTSSVPVSGLPSRTGGFLGSCSFRNDRALLIQLSNGGADASIFAIQLSTGQVVLRRDLPAGMVTFSAWSQDGRYVAASSGLLSSQGPAGTPLSTDVLDVDTGAVVAHLDGGAAGFSGDDQLIALSEGSSGTASVIEWRTGREVWKRPASWILPKGIRSVPASSAMALTVAGPSTTPDVVLVRSNGTSKVVARSAVLLTLGTAGVAG